MEKIDEVYYIVRAMHVYGGSFVQALGSALALADAQNIEKIKSTWPEYWEQYRDFGERIKRKDEREEFQTDTL